MRGVFIGLGSNKGDRETYLAEALDQLRAAHVEVLAVSSIYENPALLPEGAPEEWNLAYLNQVVQADTDLPPHSLLMLAKAIEARMGRKPGKHWSPREIDVDIIAYHDLTCDEPDITLPHAGLLERDFVLVPLAEITPNWLYPKRGEYYGKTAHELMMALPQRQTIAYRSAPLSKAS